MPAPVQTPLPIDRHIDEIVAHVRATRRALVVAPPGAGKTTRLPPALAEALGRTILLQPRRVAARTLARRIASERGWSIGNEIGWHIRFERRFSTRTRLVVATEGILTARLQSDPLLSDFAVVILDEFHERSIHADLALALTREAGSSRDDLAIVVMSATIDARALSDYLGADIFEADTPRHSLEVGYRPGVTVAEAVRETIGSARGDILCFLPGAREIERERAALGGVDALVLPLHGSLGVDAQEQALAPATQRKVILATNIAETSLTVEGVTDVIDSGLHKVLRYDAETAIDHLVLERISLDSAEQRAGRAGRTGPGRATRLWDARDILRPHREPEIRRVDLAGALLDLIAWGGDPQTFPWFERPPEERIEAAVELLRTLGAVRPAGAPLRLTALGEQLRRFPLHPRLAKLIVSSGGSDEAIRLAAALSERRSADAPPPNVVEELRRIAPRRAGMELNRAILAAYPDRVAMRRSPRSDRLLLASGTGAVLAKASDIPDAEFLVALEITGAPPRAGSGRLQGGSGEALVRMASPVKREWLEPTRREIVHASTDGPVRVVERHWYGALLLHEEGRAPDPGEAERLLASRRRIDPLLQRRLAFAGLERPDTRLEQLAPLTIPLPSGRQTKLDYRDDGSVFAAAKLQELFGLAETPRIGPDRTPITFELLAPNGRPVQTTRDLRSFWNNTYPEVRKELRGRYPKHPWPEDPWSAKATHRVTKGGKKR